MHRKEIKRGAPAPAGWGEELDRGIDDVDHGRVMPVSDVISDLDTTLAEMANESDDQVGHGHNIPDRATANRRPQN